MLTVLAILRDPVAVQLGELGSKQAHCATHWPMSTVQQLRAEEWRSVLPMVPHRSGTTQL